MTTYTPTFAGFVTWVRDIMQIPTEALPDNSIALVYAYDVAVAIVNPLLAGAGGACVAPLTSSPIYTLAVYNLGGDNLINFAPDIPPSTYFTDKRVEFTSLKWSAGAVSSASDVSTSTSVLNPDFMKEFTMANLQNLKTPWGRQYLAFAQSYGPLWGLS